MRAGPGRGEASPNRHQLRPCALWAGMCGLSSTTLRASWGQDPEGSNLLGGSRKEVLVAEAQVGHRGEECLA